MKREMVVGAGLVAALLVIGAGAHAEEAMKKSDLGKELFRANCASCHGADGSGSGPVAPFLTISPVNLTRIAERNDGEFPFLRVFQVIDGRSETRGHGTNQMPVWGSAFQEESAGMYGEYGSEPFVRARIAALTFYVESLQQR